MMELSFNPLLIGVPLPTCRLPELRVKLPRMFQSPSHRGTASNMQVARIACEAASNVSIPFSSGYRFQHRRSRVPHAFSRQSFNPLLIGVPLPTLPSKTHSFPTTYDSSLPDVPRQAQISPFRHLPQSSVLPLSDSFHNRLPKMPDVPPSRPAFANRTSPLKTSHLPHPSSRSQR